MGTTETLRSSIRDTHDRLRERFEDAREMVATREEPRRSYELIDTFLAEVSKHLHATDAVLAPAARKRLADGKTRLHDYLCAVRELEVVLAHVKAHEYGSVYETTFAWSDVWDDVDEAMAEHRHQEEWLAEALTEAMDDDEVEQLAADLRQAQAAAPSRPHPYVPHTGLPGLVARKVMSIADRFWDTVEGRMIPEPAPAPKKRPGLIGQYLLGDPRFEEEPEEELPGSRR